MFSHQLSTTTTNTQFYIEVLTSFCYFNFVVTHDPHDLKNQHVKCIKSHNGMINLDTTCNELASGMIWVLQHLTTTTDTWRQSYESELVLVLTQCASKQCYLHLPHLKASALQKSTHQQPHLVPLNLQH